MGVDAVLLVKTKREYSDREILKLSYRIAEAFFREGFWIARPNSRHAWDGPRHAITRAEEEEYIAPGEDHTKFLRVFVTYRHYGPGYERGPLDRVLAIASWLDRNIDGGVWYCSDHEEYAEPFTPERREEMWSHFCSVGHIPYTRPRGPECDFCLEPMVARLFDGPITGYQCDGCGHKVQVDSTLEAT